MAAKALALGSDVAGQGNATQKVWGGHVWIFDGSRLVTCYPDREHDYREFTDGLNGGPGA